MKKQIIMLIFCFSFFFVGHASAQDVKCGCDKQGNQITCNEALNSQGKNRCDNNCDCTAGRTCSDAGYCQGIAVPACCEDCEKAYEKCCGGNEANCPASCFPELVTCRGQCSGGCPALSCCEQCEAGYNGCTKNCDKAANPTDCRLSCRDTWDTCAKACKKETCTPLPPLSCCDQCEETYNKCNGASCFPELVTCKGKCPTKCPTSSKVKK